jgi:hypothetical protein
VVVAAERRLPLCPLASGHVVVHAHTVAGGHKAAKVGREHGQAVLADVPRGQVTAGRKHLDPALGRARTRACKTSRLQRFELLGHAGDEGAVHVHQCGHDGNFQAKVEQPCRRAAVRPSQCPADVLLP